MTLTVLDSRTRTAISEYLVRLPGWTLEAYLERAPESAFWEFARGEVIVHSPVRAEHQDLTRFLTFVLHGYCLKHGCGYVYNGPAAVQVLPDVVREPDVFVVRPEDRSRVKGVPVRVRPMLVVEVVSPSTRSLDLVEKAHDYALAGIPEYWAVDRERRAFHAFTLEGGRYRETVLCQGRFVSTALPGFWLQVEWLWQDPLPSEWETLERILGRAIGQDA